MTQRAMMAFLDALRDDPTVARGVETALTQPANRTVIWAVARYAKSLGYAVDVADVDRERQRRLKRGRRAAGNPMGAGRTGAPLLRLVQS